MKSAENYNLIAHNTFKIDVCCSRFLEYSSIQEAQQVAKNLSTPYLIIGGGSNLLFTRDYKGTVVHSNVLGIEWLENGMVRCGSGETWDHVVECCVERGLYGAENLSYIPGEVGASAVQNIGAYGAEACDIIHSVEAVEIPTGRLVTILADECQYGYRDSRFKHEWKGKYLIVRVTYAFNKAKRLNLDYGNIRAELDVRHITSPTLADVRNVIIDIRRRKLPDPEVLGNAGSFFVNPLVDRAKFMQIKACYPHVPHYTIDESHEKIPAGWLIEQCGWKGRSLGRAGVHENQALVLVNRGGASGDEIVSLCEAIQKDVQRQFGILIQPEVNII